MASDAKTQPTVNGSPVLVTVVHGALASTARPAGVSVVHWVGSVTPINAIDGDLWTNTGLSSGVPLGPVPLFSALAPLPDFSWTSVAGVGALSLIYRFEVASSSSTNWAVRVTSAPAGGGDLMFEAFGIGDLIYQCSWPWMYDTAGPTDFHIGIRNIAGAASDFNLTALLAVRLG